MDSITKYIESKLLLKVNRKKSKIGRPIEIKYLGFTFTINSKPRSIKPKLMKSQYKR